MLDSVKTIRDMIVDKVGAAWGFDIARGNLFIGKQAIPFSPYGGMPANSAVIRLDNVPRDFGAMRQVTEDMVFEIGGRFLMKPGELIEDAKVDRAAQLGDALVAGSASVGGMLPLIVTVGFAESDDPNEPTYEVLVRFRVRVLCYQ